MAMIRKSLLSLAWLVASVPAFAAGIVEVNFVKADEFTDIGRGAVERERHLAILSDHLKSLGQRLPNGQALTVDVLDVDLAGEVWPTRRMNEVRILKGSVDWPRMSLRWTLQADGRTLRTGADQLKDMAYLLRGAGLGTQQALAYDLRMLDAWFAKTFATDAPH
jgi:hypothetical protein